MTTEQTAVPAAPVKYEDCPLCGFHFPKPQAQCNAPAACARRAAARNGEPVPVKAVPAAKAVKAAKAPKPTAAERLAAYTAAKAAKPTKATPEQLREAAADAAVNEGTPRTRSTAAPKKASTATKKLAGIRQRVGTKQAS